MSAIPLKTVVHGVHDMNQYWIIFHASYNSLTICMNLNKINRNCFLPSDLHTGIDQGVLLKSCENFFHVKSPCNHLTTLHDCRSKPSFDIMSKQNVLHTRIILITYAMHSGLSKHSKSTISGGQIRHEFDLGTRCRPDPRPYRNCSSHRLVPPQLWALECLF